MMQMIQVLGIKRIFIIAALLSLNLLLAAAVYLYLTPHNADLAKQLQALSSQVSAKRADAATLTTQYQTIEDQKVYFGNLQTAGFFGDQNRTLVRQRIADIQKFTNILAARYNVTAAQVEHNPAADDAGYVLLDSPITIDVDALDDTDFYSFAYWLENAFPGHVSVTKIELSRPLDVSQATLKQIGNGIPATLIKGQVSFSWRTMVPAAQVTGGAPRAERITMAQRKSFLGLLLGAALIAVPAVAQSPVTPATQSPLIPGQAQAPYQPQTAAAPAMPQVGQPLAIAANGPDLQGTLAAESKLRQAEPPPAPDESLFFTPWQHALLQEAKRGFLTRPPGSATASAEDANKPTIREISLGGIVYRGPNDWTIYLNNQRVAPDALPDQVMDLKVHDTYIDLKWFDTANNLIFPIRLREHQRFNLDARMFLPGIGVETASSKP